MARVTVEDCTQVITSKFELVALAAQRAKEISSGAKLTVDRDNDKNPVVALREIAERTVSPDTLKEALIQKNQKLQSFEEQDLPEDDMSMEIASEMANLQTTQNAEQLSDMYGEESDDEADLEAEEEQQA